MSNLQLEKLRAEGMADDQVRAEIARTDTALNKSPDPKRRLWLQQKREIFQRELDTRGHLCPECKAQMVYTAEPRNWCQSCLAKREKLERGPVYRGD